MSDTKLFKLHTDVVTFKKVAAADYLLPILSARLKSDDYQKDKREQYLSMLLDVLEFYKTQGLFGWVMVGAFYIGEGISKYSSDTCTILQNTAMFERGQSIFLAIDTVMSKTDMNLLSVPTKYRRFRKPGTVIDYNLFVLVNDQYRINPIFFKMLEHLSGSVAIQNPDVLKECESMLLN